MLRQGAYRRLVAANRPADGWQIVSDSDSRVERLLLAEPGSPAAAGITGHDPRDPKRTASDATQQDPARGAAFLRHEHPDHVGVVGHIRLAITAEPVLSHQHEDSRVRHDHGL